MKKIIYIAFVLLLSSSIKGQQNNCLDAAGISTNPADPVNSQCGGNLLNTFDWMQEKFAVDFICAPIDSVGSPFHTTGNQYTLHFKQAETKDYLPEDGWELLMSYSNTDHRSIVMYNKYTSIVRVFSVLPRCNAPFASQRVALKFQHRSREVTGLFATAGAYTQTMDEESVLGVSSLLGWPTVSDQFMYADYQVEYDPCTCNHDALNDLQISYRKVNTADIRMVGRMTGYSAGLEAIDGHEYLRPAPGYLTSLIDEGSGAFESAGSHTFNTWNQAVSHYDSIKGQVSAHEDQYKAFYTLSSILGLATKEGSTFTKGLKQLNEDIIGGLGYDLLNGVKYVGKVANTGLGILNQTFPT